MTVLRAFLHYAVLVGLPFIGVLLVMHFGAQLTPPPSIQGKWMLNADLRANDGTACAEQLAGFEEQAMRINQSGAFLEVRLPNRRGDTLAGKLSGASFHAEAQPALFGDHIFGMLRVTGTLDGQGKEIVMRGLIAMPRRVDCIPVPFVARLAPDNFLSGKE